MVYDPAGACRDLLGRQDDRSFQGCDAIVCPLDRIVAGATNDAAIAAAATPTARVRLTKVHRSPTIADATKSPTDWIAARRPKAEPRRLVGASAATAV